ncbi:MAG: ShlB/FhaC/HecB family hemolysin secretion/activation protein [Gammaproteobacteria bacterium]|nr:ShlB/FhaC/HecB family hemolysin secretion/activation protein [Gammaproteobacteria bacterium]
MTLLPFVPEVIRLRRVAKACAAGEMSRTQYRETRRQVIAQLLQLSPQQEDTVPRFDMDITQRRQFVPVASKQVPESRSWSLPMLLILLMLILTLLPNWVWSAQLSIPAVQDRDPNPNSSLRIEVTQLSWHLTDQVDDIDRAAIEQLLQQQLAAARVENSPQAHGFSRAELEEVGRFLNALGVHDKKQQINRSDIQDLLALVATQKERRGVSVVQLENIAQALQVQVRQQGYPLAVAFVPSQQVSDGVVHLQVMVGVLAQVESVNQAIAVPQVVETLVGHPVREDLIATRLNVANRNQPMRAQVRFVPGEQIGETRMLFTRNESKQFSGMVQVDNYGVEQIGQERLSWRGQFSNLLRAEDVLLLSASSTLSPTDHQYGSVGYRTRVLDSRYEVQASVGYVDMSWADIDRPGIIDIQGDGVLVDFKLTDTRTFTRTYRSEWIYRLGYHDLDWNVGSQSTWFTSAAWSGHKLWDDHAVAVQSDFELTLGGVDEQRRGQDSTYWRVRAEVEGWTPINLPWTQLRAKLIVGLQAQFANDLLPATARLSAGGPDTNRGFDSAIGMLDQGVTFSSSLRFSAPVGEWWMFVDTTFGERNGGERNGGGINGRIKSSVHLSSLGVGWEANLLRSETGILSTRFTVGIPITRKQSITRNDDDTQFFWTLRFAY